ncbi:MAG TPA: hypothetical protein PLC40_13340, partial [Candidatus Hydrogenedentes bacterium]|nr:hypothetical protein [Candidatus Hydrogenedentota bacterium]
MRQSGLFVGLAVLATCCLPCAWAVSPTADEIAEAQRWSATALTGDSSAGPVFSFLYDGKPSREVLAACAFTEEESNLDDIRTKRTHRWTDAKTGIE